MDNETLVEFSQRNFPPIPLPITNTDSSASLLYPCDGKGLVVTSVPIDDYNDIHMRKNYQLLSNNYQKYGYSLDWRVHSITDDFSINRTVVDSEGFYYRLMERFIDTGVSRISYGCVNSLQNNKFYNHHNNVKFPKEDVIFPLSSLTQSLLSLSSCPDVVITFSNRVFLETAIGIKQAIEKLNLPNIIVAIWSDMKLGLLNIHCSSPLQIAIAPHEETPLLTNYIVFQMEQTWSDYFIHPRYLTILREAQAIWTFSNQQFPLISQIGVNLSNIWLIPLYVDKSYLESTINLYQTGEIHSIPKYNDIIIFGSYSERRANFLNILKSNTEAGNRNIILGGVLGGPKELFFGHKRDFSVRTSKVSKIN